MSSGGSSNQSQNESQAINRQNAATQERLNWLQQYMAQNTAPTANLPAIKPPPGTVGTTPMGGATVGGPSGGTIAPSQANTAAASGAVPPTQASSVNPQMAQRSEILKRVLAAMGSQPQAQPGMHQGGAVKL